MTLDAHTSYALDMSCSRTEMISQHPAPYRGSSLQQREEPRAFSMQLSPSGYCYWYAVNQRSTFHREGGLIYVDSKVLDKSNYLEIGGSPLGICLEA
ncbi:hypothetical protein KQX54_021067 [Cotesia glomerata]|uniref:Uncharacterized protein n=1 Tax=Cotesia glomerata TaxID=32391 RepID=A0AAV7HMJ3_COTGL|nr:hypothetical protein KQX54_021067 [Cotesia glomerata]